MTAITLAPPIVGEKNTAAEPKAGTAIKAVEEYINSNKIDSTTNIKAEGVTEAALTSAVQTKLNQKSAGLELVKQAGSTTATAGNLYLMETNAATLTLPAATLNRQVGIICNVTALSVKLKAAGEAKIFGDFLTETGATECTLLVNQHLIVEASGTNWYILSGEPKREQVYGALTSRTGNALHLGSAVRPVFVTLVMHPKVEHVAGELKVGGVQIGTFAWLNNAEEQFTTFSFFLPPGLEWELKSITGALTGLFSSYLTL